MENEQEIRIIIEAILMPSYSRGKSVGELTDEIMELFQSQLARLQCIPNWQTLSNAESKSGEWDFFRRSDGDMELCRFVDNKFVLSITLNKDSLTDLLELMKTLS